MSNLATHLFYRIVNQEKELLCERAFLDHPTSLESGRSPKDFHVLGFSVSFERDIIGVISFLENSRIPSHRNERGPWDPIVLVGGIVPSMNPEPFTPIADLIVLGEGEDLPEILKVIKEGVFSGKDKDYILEDVAERFQGIVLSKKVEAIFSEGRLKEINYPKKVGLRFLDELWRERPAYTFIKSQDVEFPGTFVVEVERGCPARCKFCAVSHLYSFRERPLEELKSLIDEKGSGFERVGLMGAGLSFYRGLEGLVEYILSKGKGVSFSSLRVDRVSRTLMGLLPKLGLKTITVAPETGNEELRKSIGKPIKDQEILDFVKGIRGSVERLRLYFMYGLPGERQKDLEDIISLVERIEREARGIHISVSFSPFSPKPRTPFENEPMESLKSLRGKEKFLRRGLGRKAFFDSIKWAAFQTLVSFGDRRLYPFLKEVALKKVNFTHIWDRFDFSPDAIVFSRRDSIKKPWEFLDV